MATSQMLDRLAAATATLSRLCLWLGAAGLVVMTAVIAARLSGVAFSR